MVDRPKSSNRTATNLPRITIGGLADTPPECRPVGNTPILPMEDSAQSVKSNEYASVGNHANYEHRSQKVLYTTDVASVALHGCSSRRTDPFGSGPWGLDCTCCFLQLFFGKVACIREFLVSSCSLLIFPLSLEESW